MLLKTEKGNLSFPVKLNSAFSPMVFLFSETPAEPKNPVSSYWALKSTLARDYQLLVASR